MPPSFSGNVEAQEKVTTEERKMKENQKIQSVTSFVHFATVDKSRTDDIFRRSEGLRSLHHSSSNIDTILKDDNQTLNQIIKPQTIAFNLQKQGPFPPPFTNIVTPNSKK